MAATRTAPARPSSIASGTRAPVGAYQTSFVGRGAEARSVRSQLAPGRVVTLLGPSGIGKTRLAVELTRSADRSLEISLAGARSAESLASAVAAALEVRLPDVSDPAVQLGHALAERALGIVLFDACEGLDTEARRALGRLSAAAAGLPILTTSQRALGFPRERVVSLPPLEESAARSLLLDRARCARGGGGMGDAELGRVGELVARLGRIPLALELAAARLALFDLDGLLSRLEQGLDVLDEHAVLTRTVSFVLDGLPAWERAGLVQATCFEGDFDLAGAEAVLELDSRRAMDWVAAMVGRSLLSVRRGPAGTRYTVYEAVAHGVSRRVAPGERAQAEDRHAAYFARVASAYAAAPDRTAWRAWVHRERRNLAAAEQRGRDPLVIVELLLAQEPASFGGQGFAGDRTRLRRAVETARAIDVASLRVRALVQEGRFLRVRGRFDEARAALDEARALAAASGTDALRALAEVEAGRLLVDEGEHEEAERRLEAGLALDPDRPLLAGDAHLSLGVIAYHRGVREEAARRFELARASYERAREVSGRAVATANLAAIARLEERYERARRGFREAAELHLGVGNLRGRAIAMSNLGNVERCRGDFTAARGCFAGALRLLRFVGDRRSEALAHCFFGQLELAAGNLDDAEAALERSRALGEGAMSPQDFAQVIDACAELATARGHAARARRLGSDAEALRARVEPLEVAADGSFFARGRGRVSLARRASAKLVLAALVAERQRGPGGTLDREALVTAGWPGERILEKAARQRLYVLINTLRKLGLDALETTDDGYRLDPAIPVVVVED